MIMKNNVICEYCSTENPFYSLTCKNCNSFLRSKIPNIDLWSTINKIIDSPLNALKTIVQSDHKNFVIIMLILAGLKNILNVIMYINNSNELSIGHNEILVNLLLGTILFTIIFLLNTIIVTSINKFFGIDNRIKDNISIFAYSYLPVIILLVVLLPIYFAMYGFYWFLFNPSPFMIKPLASNIFFIIEILFYLWSCILFVASMFIQSRNLFYSILVGFISFTLIIVTLYYSLKFLNSLII